MYIAHNCAFYYRSGAVLDGECVQNQALWREFDGLAADMTLFVRVVAGKMTCRAPIITGGVLKKWHTFGVIPCFASPF
jgi:hypothetical protein